MAKINFFYEDVLKPKILHISKIKKGLAQVAFEYEVEIVNLNYIFCSDEYLLQVNKEHLDHDYYTDIITFPFQEGSKIEADIFISIDRILDNAHKLQVQPIEEFYRVMSHGLLHLIGFKDKSPNEKKKMRQAEEDAIKILSC